MCGHQAGTGAALSHLTLQPLYFLRTVLRCSASRTPAEQMTSLPPHPPPPFSLSLSLCLCLFSVAENADLLLQRCRQFLPGAFCHDDVTSADAGRTAHSVPVIRSVCPPTGLLFLTGPRDYSLIQTPPSPPVFPLKCTLKAPFSPSRRAPPRPTFWVICLLPFFASCRPYFLCMHTPLFTVVSAVFWGGGGYRLNNGPPVAISCKI